MPMSRLRLSLASNAKQWFMRRAVAGAMVVGLADQLFFTDEGVGLSLAVFVGAVGTLAAVLNPVRASRRRAGVAVAIMAAGWVALIEDATFLSLVFGLGGLALGATVLVSKDAAWSRCLRAALATLFRGPSRLAQDVTRVRRAQERQRAPRRPLDWAGWIVPLCLSLVFIMLFSSANPLIESLVGTISPRAIVERVPPWRVLFWAFVFSAAWSMLHLQALRTIAVQTPMPTASEGDWRLLMNANAIRRSLVLFNLLFAAQTFMDLGYLWGGRALPTGMSYAAYAHRGAYPLLVSALLATVFVLLALRQQEAAETAPPPRALLLVFVGQNILLVLSSILRLDLYVAAYSLTYWRVAAFIWMGLVAFGLLTILIRIQRDKPNSWLIGLNAAALALTLYACCFLNVADLVARYNLAHCREVAQTGPHLDRAYLRDLGPRAIPAIDAWRGRFEETATDQLAIDHIRKGLVEKAARRSGDWRNLTLASWRLERYLANKENSPAIQP